MGPWCCVELAAGAVAMVTICRHGDFFVPACHPCCVPFTCCALSSKGNFPCVVPVCSRTKVMGLRVIIHSLVPVVGLCVVDRRCPPYASGIRVWCSTGRPISFTCLFSSTVTSVDNENQPRVARKLKDANVHHSTRYKATFTARLFFGIEQESATRHSGGISFGYFVTQRYDVPE